MAIEFVNPLTAGTVLIRSDIRSQNYVPGVSGWIIEADGDAEFNNLVVRGTFQGQSFIINSMGAFFYDGIPTTGNLIASIASDLGTDSHGNGYGQGIFSYAPGFFYTAMRAGGLLSGFLDGLNIPDTTNAATFGINAAGGTALPRGVWIGPKGDTTRTVQPAMTLLPGIPSDLSNPSTVTIGILGNGTDRTYGAITGAWTRRDTTGTFETWHNFPFAAGWAGATSFNGNPTFSPMQYRIDAEDNCWIYGLAQSSSTAMSIGTLPSGYFNPVKRSIIAADFNIGGTATPGFMQVTETGVVNSSLSLGGKTIASGSQIYINAKFPLGNLT